MSKIKVYDFEERLIENLKNDPKYLKGFKNYIIKEYKKDRDLKSLKANLSVILKAQRNISKLSKETKLSRANIYRILSSEVDPSIGTMRAILNFLGFDIDFVKI
ncbi:MAG: helix-turn-helix domain-containing protein [Elusimicrobia bacterium]|jgi:DNA-binding phage protein|nr:helix-turn-helix domain-containing protein [Elusimicrobiota bacterium]MBQ3943347.1 helix-turn-helix domain-containing protein [Elusimicrobiota bacterium]MBR4631837.1 helix-turn-helix domain-containing protein [Elusimicrobiota bacterium]